MTSFSLLSSHLSRRLGLAPPQISSTPQWRQPPAYSGRSRWSTQTSDACVRVMDARFRSSRGVLTELPARVAPYVTTCSSATGVRPCCPANAKARMRRAFRRLSLRDGWQRAATSSLADVTCGHDRVGGPRLTGKRPRRSVGRRPSARGSRRWACGSVGTHTRSSSRELLGHL